MDSSDIKMRSPSTWLALKWSGYFFPEREGGNMVVQGPLGGENVKIMREVEREKEKRKERGRDILLSYYFMQ